MLGRTSARRLVHYSLLPSRRCLRPTIRLIATPSQEPPSPVEPYQHPPKETYKYGYLVSKIRSSPTAMKVATALGYIIGFHGVHNTAIRACRVMYSKCAGRELAESSLIHGDCQVPQTFQTWFQITNLHVWLLIVRFRALPYPYGKLYIQSLVDFFFADIEDRLRHVLGANASQRTITSYMKEYRDLWNGAQIALDMGIVAGDWEMSGAIWRNVFDARGWDLGGTRNERGELVASPTTDATSKLEEAKKLKAVLKDRSLTELPYHLYLFTAYMRREAIRLEAVPDEEIMIAEIGEFGPIKVVEDDIPVDVPLELPSERNRKH